MTLGSKGALTGQLMALLIHWYQWSLSVSSVKAELRGEKNSWVLTIFRTKWTATQPLPKCMSRSACGRTPRREEFLTICRTKYPATQPLPECRWRVAEFWGEKNSWLSAGPNTPQHNLYLSVGGVRRNSEERRILDYLRDQILRNTTFTWV